MKRKIRLAARSADGIPCDRPEITLRVRTRYGDFVEVPFVVDTGSDLTSMPLDLARDKGIPLDPARAMRGTAHGLLGTVEKYLGSIHVRVAAEEFDWPCNFLMPPATNLLAPTDPRRRYAVLGRAGFLREFAACVDGDFLFLRQRWPSRPWWYRLARRFFPPFATEHPIRIPL